MHEYSNKDIDWGRYYQAEAKVFLFDPAESPHVVIRNEFAASMIPRGVKSILDVGCGGGWLLKKLNKKLDDDVRLVGVDASKPRIDAKDKAEIEYKEGFITDLPFKTGEFELVSAVEVLEHVPNIEDAVTEVVRVSSSYVLILVPGYQKIPEILCPHCLDTFPGAGHLHSFTPADLNQLLIKHNLKIVGLKEYIHYPLFDMLPIVKSLSLRTRQRLISWLQFIHLLPSRKGYYLGILAKKAF